MKEFKLNTDKAMNYKGYIAIVDFSAEDEVFFGKIWGINDTITFEGESVTELKQAFRDAVDDYLDLCEKIGKEPQKAYKGSFNVRIKPEIHKQAALAAEKRGISLNQLVESAIRNVVDDCIEKWDRPNANLSDKAGKVFICKENSGSVHPRLKRFQRFRQHSDMR